MINSYLKKSKEEMVIQKVPDSYVIFQFQQYSTAVCPKKLSV